MAIDKRIFFKNNTSLVEITESVSGFKSDSYVIDFVAAEDKLIIGSVLPFNHLYFKFVVPNEETSTPTVKFWDVNAFRSVIDLVDLTNGFKNDGIIRWEVPENYNWYLEQYSYNVTGLSTTEIYNMYWAEISFSADLTATTDLKFVGHRYSSDEELYAYYPDLSQTTLLTQYQTGKTDWSEQAIMAADNIHMHLKAKNLIVSDAQILSPDVLKIASIHKTAEIIYSAFGSSYKDNKAAAALEFDKSINMKQFKLDSNGDGRLSRPEMFHTTGGATR